MWRIFRRHLYPGDIKHSSTNHSWCTQRTQRYDKSRDYRQIDSQRIMKLVTSKDCKKYYMILTLGHHNDVRYKLKINIFSWRELYIQVGMIFELLENILFSANNAYICRGEAFYLRISALTYEDLRFYLNSPMDTIITPSGTVGKESSSMSLLVSLYFV